MALLVKVQKESLDRYVVYAIVFAAILAAAGLWAFLPSRSSVTLAREAYREKQLEARAYLQIREETARLQTRVADLEGELGRTENSLRYGDVTPSLLAEMTSLARVSGVALVRFTPGQVSPSDRAAVRGSGKAGGGSSGAGGAGGPQLPEGYVSLPFQFELSGTLSQVKGFLTLLAGQGQPVRVASFSLADSIAPSAPSGASRVAANGSSPTLSATLRAEALAFQKADRKEPKRQ